MYIRIPYFDIAFEFGRKSRADAVSGPDPTETRSSDFQFLGLIFVRWECKFDKTKVVGLTVISKRLFFQAGTTTT